MKTLKKKATIAMDRYIASMTGPDFRVPETGEMRAKLDPHVRAYADSLSMKKGKKQLRLRPIMAGIIVVVLLSVITIEPVRAGIIGALVELYDMLRGGSEQVTFTLDMHDSELLSNETGDSFTYTAYTVAGRRVALVVENSETNKQAWADRQGKPFIVDGLQFKPYEAMCFEDEEGFYAIIETDQRLIVMLDGGDRLLFTDILRSIAMIRQ